jgi:3-deoxy-D-manno-octulosonate 8-phosphate phosphatase (KDO 8-P phosphatase)
MNQDPLKRAKANNIKFLVLDVDGVMTDGGMYYTESGDQFKKFNTKDGMGIQLAMKAGLNVAFLSSGSQAMIIRSRAKTLGVDHVYIGPRAKLDVLSEWCREFGLELDHVAYIGDDINDLEVISVVGLAACPADSVKQVKEKVKIVLTKKGGEGCVREFVDEHLLS